MKYTIYKVTNNINGKYYIGKHQTKDLNDGYMGSGKLIRRAIEKYGMENFTKEILFIFDNEEEMNAKEKALVNINEMSYNLCEGGKGGFGYINRSVDLVSRNRKISKLRDYNNIEYRKKLSITVKEKMKFITFEKTPAGLEKCRTAFLGKKHTEETKRIIGEKNSKNVGEKNSQFGTMWITNGLENKKMGKNNEIPIGWYRGRISKK